MRGEIVPQRTQIATFPDLSGYGVEPRDFAQKMQAIVRALECLSYQTTAEAKTVKKQITHSQRLLRQVKREITATIQAMNAAYQNKKAEVGTSFGSAVARGFFGGRTVGRYNAAARQDLRNAQLQAVAPYKGVKETIDQVLLQISQFKDEIDRYVTTN